MTPNWKNDESPTSNGKAGLNEFRDSVPTGVSIRSDLLFEKASTDALFDRSEYDPSPVNFSPPSQIRGSSHRAAHRNTEFDEANEKHLDVIPNPHNFMESQMDRQDAMAEMAEIDEWNFAKVEDVDGRNLAAVERPRRG